MSSIQFDKNLTVKKEKFRIWTINTEILNKNIDNYDKHI